MKKTSWLLAVLLGACAADPALDPVDNDPEDRDPLVVEGKAEAWDRANNPSYVVSDFLYNVNQLPLSGAGPKPIPGDYWAVASDNLNVKWDGQMSPAEKYARAFGRSVTEVQDAVSEENGVKGHTERRTCSADADCESLNDGSACSRAYDGSVSRCIPTWWGICHGWAPYALSEPQATMAVTHRAPDGTSITFQPGDLEALMSLVYTRIPTKFLSARCNRGLGDGNTIHTDNSGRIDESECRDMNPGSWHVLVTNMMGLRHQGFVLDQTTNYEVWNQPGWKYEITNAQGGALREVSRGEANGILGQGMARTELLPTTAIAAGAAQTGVWSATLSGEVTFHTSGTGDADLYVRKGAEASESANDCASTGTSADETCRLTVAAGDQIHWRVLGYSASSATLGVEVPGDGPYVYNSAAKKFFHVAMSFTFVVEARPGTSAHDAADYSQTKHYEYILETDENGKILGGEWAGASRGDHPDFAWWPTAKPSGEVAGISYDLVRALNDEAAGAPVSSDRETLFDHLTLPHTLWSRSKYAALNLPAGYRTVTVTMTGTGDARLMVGPKGHYPRIGWGSNLCDAHVEGSANQSCTFSVDPAGGTYYVRARSYADSTTVTVVADKTR